MRTVHLLPSTRGRKRKETPISLEAPNQTGVSSPRPYLANRPKGTRHMANPPVRWHPTLRQYVVAGQGSRAVRRMQTLAVVDHLEQVAITLRQAPDVDLYMLAAAGIARVLMVLGLGAYQLDTPLPVEVVDAIYELERWAKSVKQQLRLIEQDEPWS